MGALDNLKILDFTTLLPGPYASLMLADMGAQVIKISSPSRFDLVAEDEHKVLGTQTSANQAWLGRNKKNIFLNLKSSDAIEIIKKLIVEYDIIIEQFRPGVMEKLGLGYETLRAINPKLIYCSLTGYGQTGPMKATAGHDINYISRSGIVSHAGKAQSGPALMDFQIADIASGAMNSVVGILAAVNYRHMTGEGQYIDIAMLDGCIPFNSLGGAAFLAGGKAPEREGELLNGGSAYDFYETSDDKFMSVGSLEPKFWEAFCQGINRPDFVAMTACPKEIDSMKAEIRTIFKSKTQQEWIQIFSKLDACVEPVLELDQAMLWDEQIKAREMVIDVPMPLSSDIKVKQFANPIKLSESACEYKNAGYPLGYHTREIVESLQLNYEELEKKGAFK